MANNTFIVAIALAGAFLTSACMTNAPERETTPSSMPMVTSIELSRSSGNVGEPFVAEVSVHTRRLGSTEVRINSLPPGLRFDEKKMAIIGVPKADGFYSVTIAVRKKRDAGIHFNTPEGAWFNERLDIDIYRPIDESGEQSVDVAMSDYSEY